MAAPMDEEFTIGEWQVNPALDTIRRGAEAHKLEPRTMRLLLCLAGTPGSVISVDRLLTDVWSGVVVGPASVYQAVSQLRRILGDTDDKPTYIANVPRKGYRLIAPVERVVRAPASFPPAPPATGESAVVLSSMPVPSPAGTTPRARLRLAVAAVAILVIGLVAVALWKIAQTFSRVGPGIASIVVLPFIDLTENKGDQPFCDGLTEELSNWLAQIPTLRVVARTSAFAFRDQGEDVRKIGRELNTQSVLEGSMRRSGGSMRITVQLIDAKTGYHLWSENFDRPLDDAVKIQEDISRTVAKKMQVRISSDTERQFLARRSSSSQGYRDYLLARHASQEKTLQSTQRAIELYRQSLKADPDFSPAYVHLALAQLNEAYLEDIPVKKVESGIEALIVEALRRDDRFASAYGVRGALRAVQGRNADALRDLQWAVGLNPSDVVALSELARIRHASGEPRVALENYQRALSLDPFNSGLHAQMCTVLADLARYSEAELACKKARELQPASPWPYDSATWLSESRGLFQDALHWNAEAIKASGSTFEFYAFRSSLLLSLHRVDAARAVIETGRAATGADEDADVASVRVVYAQGGVDALRKFIDSHGFERSQSPTLLFEAAYAHMLLGDFRLTQDLIARALRSPDRDPQFKDGAWSARGAVAIGSPYALDLAVAAQNLGDRPAAQRELTLLLTLLNSMIAAGVERHGTLELRAKTYALLGKGDEAMKDLARAMNLGWRASWSAAHEPYFASLKSRADFQSLLSQVDRLNEQTNPASATLTWDRPSMLPARSALTFSTSKLQSIVGSGDDNVRMRPLPGRLSTIRGLGILSASAVLTTEHRVFGDACRAAGLWLRTNRHVGESHENLQSQRINNLAVRILTLLQIVAGLDDIDQAQKAVVLFVSVRHGDLLGLSCCAGRRVQRVPTLPFVNAHQRIASKVHFFFHRRSTCSAL